MLNKKAISSVMAVSLFMVVTVVAVISFQNWNVENLSKNYASVEQESNQISKTKIESIVGNTLYFYNSNTENITINEIKIGNKTCIITQMNITNGLENINLGSCVNNLTDSINEVVVVTNDNIYTKKVYFKDVLDINYEDISYIWNIGNWGSCSESCGDGIQNRIVNCIEEDTMNIANDNLCAITSSKPNETQSCNLGICCIVNVTQDTYACSEGSSYWYDDCGDKGELKQQCYCGCSGGSCIGLTWEPEYVGYGCGDCPFGTFSWTYGSYSGYGCKGFGDEDYSDGSANACYSTGLGVTTYFYWIGNSETQSWGAWSSKPTWYDDCTVQNATSACYNGDRYWYNNFGELQGMRQKCYYGCQDDSCALTYNFTHIGYGCGDCPSGTYYWTYGSYQGYGCRGFGDEDHSDGSSDACSEYGLPSTWRDEYWVGNITSQTFNYYGNKPWWWDNATG